MRDLPAPPPASAPSRSGCSPKPTPPPSAPPPMPRPPSPPATSSPPPRPPIRRASPSPTASSTSACPTRRSPSLGPAAAAASGGPPGRRRRPSSAAATPAAARAALGPLDDPEAAEIRARAFALAGAYGGPSPPSPTTAWPGRPPPTPGRRATGRAPAPRPRTTRRAGRWRATWPPPPGVPPPAPAEDPAALARELAFQEPLPPLDRPSLDAARRLLSAGGKVDGFVEDLLADVPAAPAAN